MPNWCENTLEVDTTDATLAKAIAEKVFRFDPKEKERIVDFNLLIPMPEELNITCGSFGDFSETLLRLDQPQTLTDNLIADYITENERKGLRLSLLSRQNNWTIGNFVDFLRNNPDEQNYFGYDLALGQAYIDNQLKYGARTWYDWAYNNWGVKWNANTQYCDEFNDGNTCFYVCFDTAWNPPNEWVNTLIQTFPDAKIKLTYFEPGIFFGGIESSDETETCYYQYPDSTKQALKIAEEFGYSEEDFEFSEQ
ncbi:hypothetical protein QP016_10630 [Gallibacterium anatis]|uniref:YubB ferredoxin-like domain-containing protein n=1 Tax=Gallibacterium anatis TaxID=750 RepID=A0AAX3XFC1_9PAST|nr:hypothetical protein [Gallibacterium anatis]MDK9431172.1 hypothetical protein [Gallibacterium anatis]WIM80717.1 hypothetical protein QP018_05675 [Gallibacterium anatis]